MKKLKELRQQKEEALYCVVKEKELRMASKRELKAVQRKDEKEVQRRKCSKKSA